MSFLPRSTSANKRQVL